MRCRVLSRDALLWRVRRLLFCSAMQIELIRRRFHRVGTRPRQLSACREDLAGLHRSGLAHSGVELGPGLWTRKPSGSGPGSGRGCPVFFSRPCCTRASLISSPIPFRCWCSARPCCTSIRAPRVGFCRPSDLGPGLAVWLFARGGVHVGASGLVYGLVSYIFVAGLLRRDRRAIATSLLVCFMYGALVWGVLPIQPRISWETHLAAALIGACWQSCCGVWT